MWHIDAPVGLGFWPYVDKVVCPQPPPGTVEGNEAIFDMAALDMIQEFSGNREVAICVDNTTTYTHAHVFLETNMLVSDTPASQRTYLACIYLKEGLLLKEGAELVDVYGRRWLLVDRSDGDAWKETWTVKPDA